MTREGLSRQTITSYRSINPYSGELDKSFEEHSDQQMETAIASAATCFHSWKSLSFRERRVTVAKAACIMRERADELARLITLETGKLFAAPNLMEGNVVMVKHSNC